MRTTLDIDDELLIMLKDLARRQGTTLGQTISALARRSLTQYQAPDVRNGVRLFVPKNRDQKSDLRIVNALRDDD